MSSPESIGLPPELQTDGVSVQTVHTKEELQNIYALLLPAWEKYKRCVQDNNMFAAFPSDSNYGRLPESGWPWLSLQENEEAEKELQANKLPALEEIADFLRRFDARPYSGMLDEDFVPHVDAFWYGLKHLCAFIDAHICVKWNATLFLISDESEKKLMRAADSDRFVPDEAHLDAAVALEERLKTELENV